jgi:hypothetical protein
MECDKCGTTLSINDVEKNEWNEDSEQFIIICPICETEKKLVSPLFESGHIARQYLSMIVLDSDSQNKEKTIDYMPKKQQDMIFEHLAKCDICSERIEETRLIKISKDIQINDSTYKFFISQADDVIEELSKDKVKMNCVGIKSFVYKNQEYQIDSKNLFCEYEEFLGDIKIKRRCYILENEECSIGMVSFVETNEKLILEKIWLKTQKHLEKERQFLDNLRSGKVRVLFDLVKKIHSFL